MKIKTVIFDLDGTITRPILDFDAIRKEIGLLQESGSILESMEKMLSGQRRLAEEILHSHEERAVAESTLNDGAAETLSGLRQKAVNIGILTRNRRDNALAIAEMHGLLFDAVLGREDGPVKPNAFGILRLCELFATAPADTLMVGDYLYDLLSAKAAGAVAVLLKNHRNKDFSEYADFVIDSLNGIFGIIDSF